CLVRLHIAVPELSLRHIRQAELPVLVRIINAVEKTLPLLFLRNVEEEFHDACAISMEMAFQIHDRAVPVSPDRLLIENFCRKPLAEQDFRMHADDQHFLVIGPVENPNPTPLRQALGGAPEQIMLEFRRARMLEAEYLAALWIYT